MSIEQRLREAYLRTGSPDPAEHGAYDRFLRLRARSVRTVTAVTILVLALAVLAPRLLAGQDRGVVRPPRPVPTGPALVARITANGPGSHGLAFSADGATLAVAGNHRITLWDVERRTRLGLLDAPDAPDAVAFTPDGRTLASSGYDKVVLWDPATGARRASLPMGTFNRAQRLAFSPDGRTLAAGDGGGKLILWDAARRTRLAILSTGIGGINDLAFSPDGRRVVVGGSGPAYGDGDGVAIVDLARRRHLPVLRTSPGAGPYTAVAFQADGTALAAVGDLPPGGTVPGVSLWNVTRRARIVKLAHGESSLLSHGGGLLAVAREGGEVILLDGVPQLRRLGPLPGFHPRRPFFLTPRTGTFTGDGGRLAISDGTGSVFVWSTSKP